METIGRDLRETQPVRLAASHVDALRREGRIAYCPAGTILVQPGDPADRFVYVEEGEIEVMDPFTSERHVEATLGPTQFMGEISLLYDGDCTLPMRAVCDTRVIEVARPAC